MHTDFLGRARLSARRDSLRLLFFFSCNMPRFFAARFHTRITKIVVLLLFRVYSAGLFLKRTINF